MNIYQNWGFQSNPFEVKEISGTEDSINLLVGRETELQQIKRRLFNPPKCITIEGQNGVGKTSIINVACYELSKENSTTSQIILPCINKFQLSNEDSLEDFVDYAYFCIAQTFIHYKTLLKNSGVAIQHIQEIDDYLNTYSLRTISAGIMGFSAGESIEINQGEAFKRSGFRKIIDEWLNLLEESSIPCFLICIIDNIELLRTSEHARRVFEELRDIILIKSGIRWILSGSSGIVLGVASSPRLSGILFNPIKVEGIESEFSEAILTTRIEKFKAIDKPFLPITLEGFKKLLSILNGNIRHLLDYADEYCMWLVDNQIEPNTDEKKETELQNWLDFYSNQLLDLLEETIQLKGIDFFKSASALNRPFSYSDHELLGFDNSSAMSKYVGQLESINLIQSFRKVDSKRIQLAVTPKGLILNNQKFQ